MADVRRQLGKLLWIALMGLSVGNAAAQNYERYAPQDITTTSPQVRQIPTEELDAVKGDDRVLVDALDAVVIVDSKEKVLKSPQIDSLEGVFYNFDAGDSIVFHAGLQSIVNRQIGKPITLRGLNQMAREVILYYRNCKQPIVDVQIPEQRITGGTVHLIVIESRIETVRIQPGCYFDCEEIGRWIACTQPGNRIYEPNLERDLFWLNQKPIPSSIR